MDFSLKAHDSFIGRPAADLPTPALVLSKPILERNINRLFEDVQTLGITFRPHVKTLKSLEITRIMLANGRHRKIVASTLSEIHGALPLVQEGLLDECLYSMPIYPGILPRLADLTKSLSISLMIDNEQHIDVLEAFAATTTTTTTLPWPVFIKIDVGTHRAGVEPSADALPRLVRRAEASPAVHVSGFYCHAGHSYACRSTEAAASVLEAELEGVVSASANLSDPTRKVVVSIGSTPTAHVVRLLKRSLPENLEVELHAGNFACNDMQQESTGLIGSDQQALRVLTEVCSVYPERNEALINAGTIALSKETSAVPGFGRVVGLPQWNVVRMSQEHGILGLGAETKGERADETFKVGQKVFLHCQHACITASAYYVYYVVDEGDIVREAWVPWKGW